MNKVRIALLHDRFEAERVRKHLLSLGLSAELHEEPLPARLWFVSRAAAGVRLTVPEDQRTAASKLLLEYSAKGILHAVRCPDCKSLRVDYPQFTPKSLLSNLALGLAAELGLVEKDYYCEDCHCTWPKPVSSPTRPRPHMAPDYFIEGSPHQSLWPK